MSAGNDYFTLEILGVKMKNKEIVFMVDESVDGGYEAKAAGFPIFTQGETMEEVKKNILDAVRCHFEDGEAPSYILFCF
jgi:hypothetical protein